MKYVVSNYNHKVSWLLDYAEDYIVYDRSDNKWWTRDIPEEKVKRVQNIGSDIYDKFGYIIENYDNLPDVAVYTKGNIFKYISKDEFEPIKNNTTFTPLLTQKHHTYSDPEGVVCYYEDGIYFERNNLWFLGSLPAKHNPYELMELLGTKDMKYIPFAPGSNYIVPKENILKHPRELYERLRATLDWSTYPGEAQIVERGLYTLWHTP